MTTNPITQLISQVQRNHGLEHATIHMLTARHKNFSAQGNSDHRGFHLNVYGEVSEADVAEAVNEAYRRMKAGEHQLAVHPNCGTVLVTTGFLAALAAQAVFVVEHKRQNRADVSVPVLLNGLPTAVLAIVGALIVGRPLGVALQAQYTVDGDLGDLQIVSVRPQAPSLITRLFRLLLTGNRPNLQTKSFRVNTVFSGQ